MMYRDLSLVEACPELDEGPVVSFKGGEVTILDFRFRENDNTKGFVLFLVFVLGGVFCFGCLFARWFA